MKVRIEKIKMVNFKGLKSTEIEFSDMTNISGKNATGKTTIVDAFLWVLFNKDSQGKTDFNIKTLDKNNKPLQKVESEVEIVLDVDTVKVVIKKTYREKWVKRKGEEDSVFSGHETGYFWNEVPLSQREFNDKVSSLCDESIFKLITNPQAFNCLNWQKRREILFEMAGEITDDSILESMALKNGNATVLKEILNSGKKLDDFKKQSASQKKKLKEELDLIPTRIDELNRSLPEMPELETVSKGIINLTKEVESLDLQISDMTKANEQLNIEAVRKHNEVHELRSKLRDIEFAAKRDSQSEFEQHRLKIQNVEFEISNLNRNKEENVRVISRLENHKKAWTETNEKLRKEWTEINQSQIEFDSNDFHCPTCKREFEASDISSKQNEMRTNFNLDKTEKLKKISETGKENTKNIEQCNSEISAYKLKVEEIETDIEAKSVILSDLKAVDLSVKPVAEILSDNEEYKTLSAKINALEEANLSQPEGISTLELREKKSKAQNELDTLKLKLAAVDQIEKGKARITELEARSKTLGQEISTLEKVEFAIEQFNKAKVEHVEQRINSKFKFVTFKMFENLINGGEEPTCKTLILGVPYEDANNAAKINAGIDIINALSEYYEVNAPIFIDNAESVNSLLDTDSQIIRLVVSLDNKLKVENQVSEFQTIN